ncbi:MAG: DNA mismatch repair protein MutS [Nitrospirales bacterium]|nr:DNA mismatch repair protein MutS [Nitrospirales bacterium]
MKDLDLTPLMRQFQTVKAQYPGAILFFRVGDFYEMFFEDAEEASKILEIVLTARGKVKGDPIPLCGVPYHAATGYIARLLKAGKIVALCEQVEDPKLAKGLVKREVVRVYTPGTLYDQELLPSREANYLTAIYCDSLPSPETGLFPNGFGLATLDLSTGEFWVTEGKKPASLQAIADEIFRIEPREVVFPVSLDDCLPPALRTFPISRLVPRSAHPFTLEEARLLLEHTFQAQSLHELSSATLGQAIQAAGGLLHYLKETQPALIQAHLRPPAFRPLDQEMHLDQTTLRNLEIFKPLSEHQKAPTLLQALDYTLTPMGSRLLRQWIVRPMTQVARITERQEAIKECVESLNLRMEIRSSLKSIKDLERLNSRITLAVANPRDLMNFHRSLNALPRLGELLSTCTSLLLKNISVYWDSLREESNWIVQSLVPDPPLSAKDGGIMQAGVSAELDELRTLTKESTRLLTELEARERTRTGIESLKIKFNQVFGYYFEVTKANLGRVPLDFQRKQTLANAERFTTPELQDLEGRLSSAEQKMNSLEFQLFTELRAKIAESSLRVQAMAHQVAQVDILAGLAEAATLHRYQLPIIHDGGTIKITAGRHPVIEQLQPGGGFVPNDTYLDLDTHRLLLITGPNMAGKSTYLRQVALTVLMAQIGSFVPADAATIGIVDRIFTRVGAADDLSAGQSTFMVEMTETSKILESATSRSLILLDEVGRGTSTYDGLSIAWALAEYILDRSALGARTLFATHYHEMTQLENVREGIKNYTVLVKEKGHDVLFLRKIVEGKADRSYGIQVAKLAGIPEQILDRARNILEQLEHESSQANLPSQENLTSDIITLPPTQPTPHVILEEVKQMDLFSMTPLEALNRLADLKARLEEERP